MRAAPLLLALALASVSGCQSSQDCTLIGCQDGVGVTLTGLAAKPGLSLPVTLNVCLDATCSTFKLNHTGQAPTCTSMSAGNTLCTIDGQGTVVLTTLPVPPGTAGGAALTVHATATDSMGATVLDQSQMVTVVESQPNGPSCGPACLGAEATFSP
jgi:hypothetical protein